MRSTVRPGSCCSLHALIDLERAGTDRATGLKRRTKKAKAASPPLVDESEEGPAEEEAEAEQESEVDVDSAGVLEISIRRDLARYPDAILLTQVGSFYEVSPLSPSPEGGLRSRLFDHL